MRKQVGNEIFEEVRKRLREELIDQVRSEERQRARAIYQARLRVNSGGGRAPLPHYSHTLMSPAGDVCLVCKSPLGEAGGSVAEAMCGCRFHRQCLAAYMAPTDPSLPPMARSVSGLDAIPSLVHGRTRAKVCPRCVTIPGAAQRALPETSKWVVCQDGPDEETRGRRAKRAGATDTVLLKVLF